MNDRDAIKEQLKGSVDLAEWIRRDGIALTGGPNEFKAKCPFHDDSTPSFTVFRKEGAWAFHCFGCDATGDIYEWIMRRQGVAFPEALKAVANAVGVALPGAGAKMFQPPSVKNAAERTPERGAFDPQKFRAFDPDGKAFKYLTGKRQLKPELLADYSVGQTADGEAYSFAYKWRPANWPANREKPLFEFCKVVKVDRPDGKKIEWREPKGGRSVLFGMESSVVKTAHQNGGELVICEGEIDAITWAGYGRAAVSVPGGAKYLGWIEQCYDWLQAFGKIHVSFDEDAAGRAKVVEIVTRLGIARTDIVRLPMKDEEKRFKDINECLQAGTDATGADACVINAEVIKPEKLKDIYAFEKQIWEKFHPEGTAQLGLLLPWGNYFGSSLPFRFRYGEVTVWTGYNKHGKSEVLNHCMIDLCWQGERVLIASLEVQAPETYKKLIRMAMGVREVCDDRAKFRERCLKPLGQKVWVYDAVGNADIEDVLQVMQYAYQRYGVRQFVLDSLMRFSGLDGEGQEIWNAQRAFMDRIIEFAQRNNVHIHLVAHSKKPNDRKGEAAIPHRYDVMGSSYITNLAFNVIVVWRNRAKQDELEEIFQACTDKWMADHPETPIPQFKRLLGGAPAKDQPEALKEHWRKMIATLESLQDEQKNRFQELVLMHDAYFIVDAQRGGDGDCPARFLWFHYDSLQFLEVSPWKLEDKRRLPKKYVEQPVAEMDEEF
jgi:twinkle protein